MLSGHTLIQINAGMKMTCQLQDLPYDLPNCLANNWTVLLPTWLKFIVLFRCDQTVIKKGNNDSNSHAVHTEEADN